MTGDTSHLTSSSSALLPFPILRQQSTFGFVDEAGDSGGVRRTMPLVVSIDGNIFPSLDLQTIMQFWDVPPDKVLVNLGHEVTIPRPDGTQVHVPIDQRGYMTINYRVRFEDFSAAHRAMSYAPLATPSPIRRAIDKPSDLQNEWRDSLPPLKDNIIEIGVTIAGIDAGVTPLDPNSPLVNTRLNIVNNILQR